MSNKTEKYLALSGGIGGAKLALGLSHVLDKSQLTVVVNTGDDFEHFGLHISPDIDTLLYTLADLNNTELGWGRRDESWSFLDAAKQLGLDSWFQLGDKDLAIHLYRTSSLNEGNSLTQITASLAEKLGITTDIVPMSDFPVRTMVETDMGELPFQQYFVKHRCEPAVKAVNFAGIESALPSPQFEKQLLDEDLAAVIICPSNPFLSVEPILALSGIKEQLKNGAAPVVVVSPVVQGQAIKGPTTKMMQELGLQTDVTAIAKLYADIGQVMVIDNSDAAYEAELKEKGFKVLVTNIIMRSLEDRIKLANDTIEFIREL